MGHGQRGERLLFLLNTIRRTQPFRSRNRYDQLVLPITRNPPGKIKNKVMQFNSKEYDPEKHDRWRALTVKQPYANDLVTAAYKDENGVVYGRKSIEVRSKKRHTVATFLFVRRQNRFIPEWKAALLWDWLSCTT